MSVIDDFVQSKLNSFKQAVSSAFSAVTDNQGWIRQGQFAPVQQVASMVGNIRPNPTSPTIGQSVSKVVAGGISPLQRIAENRSLSGITPFAPRQYNPIVRNVADFSNQTLKNFVNSSTFGIVDPQFGSPQTPAGYLGMGAGFATGLGSASKLITKPLNIAGEATAGLARKGLMNLAPELAGSLTAKVAPMLAKGAGGALAYAGESKLASKLGLNQQKDQFSPKNLALNTVLTAGLEGLSNKLMAVKDAMHPEDVTWMDTAINSLRNSKSSAKVKQNAKTILLNLGERYLSADQLPDNGNVSMVAKKLQKVAGTAIGTGKEPVLGLVDKAKSNPLPWEQNNKATLLDGLSKEEKAILAKPDPLKAPVGQLNSEEAKLAKNMATVGNEVNPQGFKQSFDKWIGLRQSADTKATLQASQYAKLPAEKAQEVIAALDQGKAVSKDSAPIVKALRDEFNNLFEQAKAVDPSIKYRENYLPHIWKEPPGQVEQLYAQAKQKFKFSGGRSIPTYEEGLKMGLTPKFSNPVEMLHYYIKSLEQTKANMGLFNDLKSQGLLVPASTVRNNAEFAPVIAPGFPQSISQVDANKVVQGNWYAPRDVAQKINQIFAPQDYGPVGSTLNTLGNLSGKIQDITMSGGMPATPLNSWTIAQMTKEVLAGRVVSPVKSVLTALSPEASNKFFAEQAPQIIKMQEAGVPVRSSFKISNLVDQSTVSKTFGEKVSSLWNAAVNDPTFQRFAPMLQVNLFNDIEKQALGKGMVPEEAVRVAAKAVKNFYGNTSSGDQALANGLTEDFKRAVFFAPKYRESMINFWANNLKALANPLALENQANSKFIVGATLTFLLMDKVNQANTGRHMWQNPSGKQDKMLIKTSDGYIGVPFLSSIATVPRALAGMASSAVQGNFPEVLNQGKAFLSSAIRPGLDVATNQNYYGQEITNPDNPKLGDQALYLAGQYMHPYVREGLNVLGQGLPDNVKTKLGVSKQSQPAYQTVSKALELPFRFYNSTNGKDPLATGYYFDTKDEVLKGADKQTKTQWELLHPTKDGSQVYDPGVLSSQQKALLYLNNPKLQLLEMQLAKSLQSQLGQAYDPVWDLPSNQRNQVFAARTSLPGEKNQTKKELANQQWYSDFQKKESAFFASLPPSQNQSDRPQPSAYVQQQMDAKNWADPQVKAYLDANTAYNNQLRTSLGLSPIAGYTPYQRKASIRKVSAKKIKFKKLKTSRTRKTKLKLKFPKPKFPKVKKIKVKKLRLTTLKPIPQNRSI